MKVRRGVVPALCLTLGFGLLVALIAFRFIAPPILERYLEQLGGEHGISVDLRELRLAPFGLRVVVADASGSSWQASGVRLHVAWGRDLLRGRVSRVDLEGGQAVVKLDAPGASGPEKPFDPDAFAESVLSLAGSQAVGHLSVLDLPVTLKRGREAVEARISAIHETAPDWSELSIHVATGSDKAALQLRAQPESGELSVDFDLAVRDWERDLSFLFPEWNDHLVATGYSLYIDPLGGEGSPLVSVAGFGRWSRSGDGGWKLAVLANSGAAGAFGEAFDVSLETMSAGIATDGRNRWRAYATLPAESIRIGNWTAGAGLLELRMTDGELRIHLGVEKGGLSLDLVHGSIADALRGAGTADYEVRADPLPLELLEAIKPGIIPPGVTADAALEATGRIRLGGGRLIDMSGLCKWTLRRLEWPRRALVMEEGTGSLAFASIHPFRISDPLRLSLRTLQLVNLSVLDLEAMVEPDDGGQLQLASFQARILDGELDLDPFHIDLGRNEAMQIPVQLKHLNLDKLAKLLPEFTGQVSGTVSGRADLVVNSGTVRLENGLLTLDRESPAHLAYEASGLLTRGLQPGSPAFERYRMAELALGDLRLSGLQISLFPEDGAGQPLAVRLSGDSRQEGVLVPVDFSLNVNVEEEAKLLRLLEMMASGELKLQR